MHTINVIAAVVTVAAAFAAFVRMWYCMYRETARPNVFTWVVWAILAIALLKSEWEAIGATWALSLLVNDLVCISITALVLLIRTVRRLGQPGQKLSGWDWCKKNAVELNCLAAIVVATVIWWQTSSALVALLCYLAIDFIAVGPTLHAVWKDYTAEDGWEWGLFQVANTAVILTVSEFNFEQLAYPATVCMIALAVNMIRALSWWVDEHW